MAALEKKNIVTSEIKFMYHYIAVLLFIIFASTALFLTGDQNGAMIMVKRTSCQKEQPINKERKRRKITDEDGEFSRNNSVSSCDLFSGKWVFDNSSSYPLYKEEQCSFMTDEFACQKYGRKDLKYQNWRWQPHDCDLPRFNGTAFLEKIRGKKLVFVGDSLNRNQWISLLCLIESSLNSSMPKSMITRGNLNFFQAIEYNATIGFYWSPLLVESNCDNSDVHRVRDRVVRITAIEKHAKHWTDADILIFDSFTWWLPESMTLLWGSFGSTDAIYKRVETKFRRYEIALNTWSDWLEFNINRTRTKLFFMSLSPSHFHGENWDMHHNCYNETEPIFRDDYWGIGTVREMMHIAESVIQKLETRGLKIEYLNITHLSDYRKDAHPSIYKQFYPPPSEEQLANPESYSDCCHWCLPGVPDIWNQILYSYIVNSR